MSIPSRSTISAAIVATVLLGVLAAGRSVEAAGVRSDAPAPASAAWSPGSMTGASGQSGARSSSRVSSGPDVRPAALTVEAEASHRGEPATAQLVTVEPVSPQDVSADAPLPPVLVELAPLAVDVWNADERYFAVTGETPEEIVASAQRDIPADRSGNERYAMAYAGPVVWEHVPTYAMDPSTGACTMTGVTSTTRYEATMPQWTAPAEAPAEMITWWHAVLEHLRAHEGEHIVIFEEYVSVLPARVAGQPCGQWEEIVNGWSAEIVAAQAAFDAAEAGWVLPVYAGPLDP